jgi:two-component system, OmpR family, phosphate regulon sensor histidine kinase PhoR
MHRLNAPLIGTAWLISHQFAGNSPINQIAEIMDLEAARAPKPKNPFAPEIVTMLQQALAQGISLLNADGGAAIFSYSDTAKHLELLEQSGLAVVPLATMERFACHACRRGETLLVDERMSMDASLPTLADTSLTAVIVVPIRWDGCIIGALALAASGLGRAFTSKEFEIAQMLGAQSGLILQNSQIYENTHHQIDGLGHLNLIAKELLATADIKHMMYIIAQAVVKYADAQDVHIYLYDSETGALNLGTSLWGPTGEVDRPFEPPRANGLTYTVARTGERIIAKNPQRHPLFEKLPPRHALLKFHTILGLPLKQEGKVIGVLDAFFNKALPEKTLHFLDELEDQASLALENARMHKAVGDQAQYLETVVEERTAQIVRDREMLRAIVESAGEGIVFLRADFLIEFVNQAWEQMTGLAARNVMGGSFASVFPEVTGFLNDIANQVSTEGVWTGEVHGKRSDGSEYDAAVTFTPTLDSNKDIMRLVGVFRDITAEKEVERMRRNFIANVSHELRTPITSLKVYHTLLTHVNTTDSAANYLKTMVVELNRLEKLVEDLLDIANLDRGSMPMTPQALDLGEIVQRVKRAHQARADVRALTLTVSESDQLLPIYADQERILQVATNLLVNAINHTQPGGEITVCTSRKHEDGKWWASLTISDTGTGIPPEDLPFIFDRFFRSESSKANSVPGTGLGLSIVREIVEMHGGTIRVESTLKKGTRIIVLLPLTPESAVFPTPQSVLH